MHRRLVLASPLLFGACAGYRGGWVSLPYVGTEVPRFSEPTTPQDALQQSELALSGLSLGVSLNNQLRTHDTHVYFFVVPVPVDPRSVYEQADDPGATRVTLRIAPILPNFLLRYRLARLTIDAKSVHAATAAELTQTAPGARYEFRPVRDELELGNTGRPQVVTLEFPIARPSPRSLKVQLDLSEALKGPDLPPIPPIRFVPVRWQQSYT